MAVEEKRGAGDSVQFIPVVVNTADDPSLLSATSVNALPEGVDEVTKTEQEKIEEAAIASILTGVEIPVEGAPKPGEVVKPAAVVKSAEPAQPIEEEAKPRKKDPVAERIGELTKKWRTSERELEFERGKRQAAEAALEAARKSVPATGKPKVEDFEDQLSFVEALTDWKVEEALRVSKEKEVTTTSEQQEREAVTTVYDTMDTRVTKGREKYADFDTVALNDDLDITPEMVSILTFSPIVEDILYYLGQHPDETALIADMHELQAARELGKIEAKLALAAVSSTPVVGTPPAKVNVAPAPITPIRTTGAIEKRPEDMTPAEYRAWREGSKK